jgi:hypothetical protein
MNRWTSAAVLAAALGGTGFVAASALAGQGEGFTPGSTVGPGVLVPICHALGNGEFNSIAPSAGVVFGHAGHQDGRDIIPPFVFDPNGTQELDSNLAGGQNWPSGEAIWSNGCVVPGATTEPPVTTTEPPVTTTAEPPVTTTAEPPVTTTAEPPASTTAEPPVTTTSEPVATTTEPQASTGDVASTTTAPTQSTTETGVFTPPPSLKVKSPAKASPKPTHRAKPTPVKHVKGVFLPPTLAYTP